MLGSSGGGSGASLDPLGSFWAHPQTSALSPMDDFEGPGGPRRHLGAIWGRLGASGARLEPFGRVLGYCGSLLGRLGGALGHLGALLARFGPILGSTWALLGPSWAGQGGRPPKNLWRQSKFLDLPPLPSLFKDFSFSGACAGEPGSRPRESAVRI